MRIRITPIQAPLLCSAKKGQPRFPALSSPATAPNTCCIFRQMKKNQQLQEREGELLVLGPRAPDQDVEAEEQDRLDEHEQPPPAERLDPRLQQERALVDVHVPGVELRQALLVHHEQPPGKVAEEPRLPA